MLDSVQDKPSNTPVIAPKRRRKVTIQDMEEICQLVIKYRMTETEAASTLGIGQDQWFLFKGRKKNQAEFDRIIIRLRGENLKACISTIDEAGNNRKWVNRNGQQVESTGDWRAKAWIAERVLAPERFGDRKESTDIKVVQIIAPEQAKQLLDKLYDSKQIVDVQ